MSIASGAGRPRRAGVIAPGLLLAASACAPPPPAPVSPTGSDRFFVSGYHPYWAGDSWADYPERALDELYFFEIEAAGDGSLLDRHGWPEQWLPMVAAANRIGQRVTPTLSMHDPVAFERLFQDPEAIDRLVDEAAGLLEETPGLAGLQLDFEVFQPVAPQAREGYTAFARLLDERLAAIDPDLVLSIFALAFDDDDVYDETALAQVADYLVVQGYDFHSIGGDRAGPVAALAGWGRLNWPTVVDRFEALGVPTRKIVMAVPMYGYQWPVDGDEPGARTTGDAVAIPLAPRADVMPHLPRALDQARRYGLRRDADSGSAYYVYREESGWVQGWFTDAEGLRAKYAFVRERGLGGVAVFPVAYADETLWSDLVEAFRRPRPPG